MTKQKINEPIIQPAVDNIVTVAEASATDLDTRLDQLEQRIEKQRGEQQTIIISVLIATVLIVATVAIQLMLYNQAYSTSLDSFKAQENQDIHGLENTIIQSQQNMNNALLNRPAATP